jgi:DNA-directed RNA polymerase specialized sigma24 family protein
MCYKVSRSHGDDLFQEVAMLLLTIDEAKLPQESYFNFWFYRVAANLSSARGNYGKMFSWDIVYLEDLLKEVNQDEDKIPNELVFKEEEVKEAAIDRGEEFMLNLPEFENRIVHLYNYYGNMRKVEKATGISYSALRAVKNKLKEQR